MIQNISQKCKESIFKFIEVPILETVVGEKSSDFEWNFPVLKLFLSNFESIHLLEIIRIDLSVNWCILSYLGCSEGKNFYFLVFAQNWQSQFLSAVILM